MCGSCGTRDNVQGRSDIVSDVRQDVLPLARSLNRPVESDKNAGIGFSPEVDPARSTLILNQSFALE